jgi:hypothetical protein
VYIDDPDGVRLLDGLISYEALLDYTLLIVDEDADHVVEAGTDETVRMVRPAYRTGCAYATD